MKAKSKEERNFPLINGAATNVSLFASQYAIVRVHTCMYLSLLCFLPFKKVISNNDVHVVIAFAAKGLTFTPSPINSQKNDVISILYGFNRYEHGCQFIVMVGSQLWQKAITILL